MCICVNGLLQIKIEITQNPNFFIVCGQNTQTIFKFLVKQWRSSTCAINKPIRWLTWSLSLFSHTGVWNWQLKLTTTACSGTGSWKPLLHGWWTTREVLALLSWRSQDPGSAAYLWWLTPVMPCFCHKHLIHFIVLN